MSLSHTLLTDLKAKKKVVAWKCLEKQNTLVMLVIQMTSKTDTSLIVAEILERLRNGLLKHVSVLTSKNV